MNKFLKLAGFLVLVVLGYSVTLLIENNSVWHADKQLPIPQELDVPEAQQKSPGQKKSVASSTRVKFERVENSGVLFEYENGAAGKFHLAETLGGGIGASDFDLDGKTDLIFINGGDPIHWPTQTTNQIEVYRNLGEIKFQNVSKFTDCHWSGYGHGCSLGDYNNDGFDDFLVTGYQNSTLFMNLGDGTFEELDESSGLRMDRWCATAAFGDLDRDGDLDLYVTSYAETPRDVPPPYCEESGTRIHCHPHYYPAVPDYLFENMGDGTFQDISDSSGIGKDLQYGLGVVITDLNNDFSPELFVANDGDRNLLYQQTQGLSFQEVGVASGIGYTGRGRSTGSMGIACADFNWDGLPDLVTTNFSNEPNILFLNQGDLTFLDRSERTGIATPGMPMVGWSAVPMDADLDGDWEIFIANGHVTDTPSSEYDQLPLFLEEQESLWWHSSANVGDYFQKPWHGRGAISTDLDGDGREELVISHIHATAAILKNRSMTKGTSVSIKLVGTISNRSAANTKVSIQESSGSERRYERLLSGGYLSSKTSPLVLTMPEPSDSLQLKITWPSGVIQEKTVQLPDNVLTITEPVPSPESR